MLGQGMEQRGAAGPWNSVVSRWQGASAMYRVAQALCSRVEHLQSLATPGFGGHRRGHRMAWQGGVMAQIAQRSGGNAQLGVGESKQLEATALHRNAQRGHRMGWQGGAQERCCDGSAMRSEA